MKKILLSLSLFFVGLLCFSQTKVSLGVEQLPEFTYEGTGTDTMIDVGESVVLGDNVTPVGGAGGYSFKWESTDYLDDSGSPTPVANPKESLVYTQTITDANECSLSVVHFVVVMPSTGTEGAERNSLKVALIPVDGGNSYRYSISGEPANELLMRIVGINGKTIYAKKIKNFKGQYRGRIDAELAPASYFVSVSANSQQAQAQFTIK